MGVLLYFGKVVILSGFLFSYYWFTLRNKQFHAYNRFYLIISVAASLVLPWIRIPFPMMSHTIKGVNILQIISIDDWEQAVVITPRHHGINSLLTGQNLLSIFYVLVACTMIFALAKSLIYVRRISKIYNWEKVDDIKLFHTNEPQSPFSFFKSIFWNNRLRLTSKQGNQILRHEVYHVRSHHSFDLLFLELVKCIFWFNPFFFFIKKEIKAIHEFLADAYAVSGSDKYGYAELLVLQSVNTKPSDITNSFFHTQIKRRITMMTQLKIKRYSYLSRIMALPVLFVLFCAFSVKTTNAIHSVFERNTLGKDDSVFHDVEKYLIKHLRYPEGSLKENYAATVNVKIIVDPTGKCKTIVPVEGIPADTKFFELTVTSKSKFPNSSTKPVIEPGFNTDDFVPFKESVTKALTEFKSDKPFERDVTLYLKVYFKIEKNGKKESLSSSGGGNSFIEPVIVDKSIWHDTLPPTALKDLNQEDIKSIAVSKREGIVTINLKNGDVMVIKGVEFEKNNKEPDINKKAPYDKVFTQVEEQADFPGGNAGWSKFLIKNFRYPQEAVRLEISGEVDIQFIVDTGGNISNVLAVSGPMVGGLREEAIRVIENSGKWIPAKQNGKQVTSYKTQPIIFKLQEQ